LAAQLLVERATKCEHDNAAANVEMGRPNFFLDRFIEGFTVGAVK